MATSKTKGSIGVIEGTLVYAKVGQPDNKYQSDEKEWSVEVIIDEDAAEAWDDQFQKQKAKKIKASEFEAKYRIPCPIDNAKNVYSVKLKRQATNDGVMVDENFRPKVYLDDASGERSEIGQSRKIANGSYGKVSYYISSNDYGTFARLQNVLLDEAGFKEYESTGGYGGGSEFGGGGKTVKTEAAREEVMAARPAKAAPEMAKKVNTGERKKAVAMVEEDDFSDSPF